MYTFQLLFGVYLYWAKKPFFPLRLFIGYCAVPLFPLFYLLIFIRFKKLRKWFEYVPDGLLKKIVKTEGNIKKEYCINIHGNVHGEFRAYHLRTGNDVTLGTYYDGKINGEEIKYDEFGEGKLVSKTYDICEI
jgi:hypothetical protein